MRGLSASRIHRKKAVKTFLCVTLFAVFAFSKLQWNKCLMHEAKEGIPAYPTFLVSLFLLNTKFSACWYNGKFRIKARNLQLVIQVKVE